MDFSIPPRTSARHDAFAPGPPSDRFSSSYLSGMAIPGSDRDIAPPPLPPPRFTNEPQYHQHQQQQQQQQLPPSDHRPLPRSLSTTAAPQPSTPSYSYSHGRVVGAPAPPSLPPAGSHSAYGSFSSSIRDDDSDYKRRDTGYGYKSHRDEGYSSLSSYGSSNRSQHSPATQKFLGPNLFEFQSSADKLKDKLNPRRTFDNRPSSSRSQISASLSDAQPQRRPTDNPFSPLSLPTRPRHSSGEDHRFSQPSPQSAISPRTTPMKLFGVPQLPTTHSDIMDYDRSPRRLHRIDSGFDEKPESSPHSSYLPLPHHSHSSLGHGHSHSLSQSHILNDNNSRQRDYHHDPDAMDVDKLRIDDNTAAATAIPFTISDNYHHTTIGQKRRASSPPPEPPLSSSSSSSMQHGGSGNSSDFFRRREVGPRAPLTSRLGSIPQGSLSSLSSSMRNHSYMPPTTITNLGPSNTAGPSSFGRLSPVPYSPSSAITPPSTADASCTSPYSTPQSLEPSPRSSISRTPLAQSQQQQQQPQQQQRTANDIVVTSPHKIVDPSSKHSLPTIHGVYMCDCCPKKPKKFETAEELAAHEAEKQYECSYCGNRFKNKNEAERHQNSLHVRRHSWSCSVLQQIEQAFHESQANPSQADTCGYCGNEFWRKDSHEEEYEERAHHLVVVHKFRECNSSKKFYRADHFRQHLKHSHGGTSGKWTNMLENACMIAEEPAQSA